MRPFLILLAVLAPAVLLAWFTVFPEYDGVWREPIGHFYIVTFTTFSAAVISLLLASAMGDQAQPRHVLAATAFAVMGSVFFSHGLSTPGALMLETHPATAWSAWLTLFGSAVLFVIAGFNPGRVLARRVALVSVVGVAVYSIIAAAAPAWLEYIDQQALPWHREALFYMSLGLWALAAVRLGWVWRATRNRVDAALAFLAVWMLAATVSMHRYPVWNFSWWLYHLILLVGFIITVAVLVAEYEQVRQFRLARYYLALSLILTALLALGASFLFTQFAYNTLVGELTANARALSANLAGRLAMLWGDRVTPAEGLNALLTASGVSSDLNAAVRGLGLRDVVLYNAEGLAVAANDFDWVGTRARSLDSLNRALTGEVVIDLLAPAAAPVTAYGAPATAEVIQVFTPFFVAGDNRTPIGVLVTRQEAPTLNRAIINARFTGLVTAAVTMGLLFVALLSVVGRADRIINQRTQELAVANDSLSKLSQQLRVYSEWLLGRDLLNRALSDQTSLSLARRERTVLFMDIRYFTRWSESRPAEDVVTMLNQYYNTVERVVNRHQVIKFKFTADEALAVFPTAEQAANAALELRDEIADLLQRYGLGAGIGLHTGPLVEGLLGSAAVKFYDVIGDTVNTGKRIEGAAAAREVLISASTQAHLPQRYQLGEARTIAAKGKEEPPTVYPLQGAAA